MINLYLGCASDIHPQHREIMSQYGGEWIYVDKFVKGQIDGKDIQNHDATNLPYKPNSIGAIYASHLLEHLPFVDTINILKHWYMLLDSNGVLILNVPDLEWACKSLLELQKDIKVSNHYQTVSDWNNLEHSFMQIFYGAQSHDGEYHKSGYTQESLRDALRIAGFNKIEVKKQYEAHDMGCLLSKSIKL